jgi:hypothetical protein
MMAMRILLVLALVPLGCVVVPQNRREHLADPTMQSSVDPVGQKTSRKKHAAREAAAGGDGQPAGGGCGCGN